MSLQNPLFPITAGFRRADAVMESEQGYLAGVNACGGHDAAELPHGARWPASTSLPHMKVVPRTAAEAALWAR